MVMLDNLSSRIAAILLAGLMILLVLGAALLIWPSDDGGGVRFYQLPQPAEAVAMVEALDASPPSARPAVMKALDTGVIRATLGADFPASLRRARPADARDPGYGAYDRALVGRDWRIEVLRGGRLRDGFMPGRAALRLSVRLEDGSVLTLRRRAPEAARRYLGRITLACAALLAVTLLMILVAMRQTTRPVESLARAVARFGDDLDAAPLPPGGPREIRELSSAFNTMRGQIRGLMDERTRMLAAIAHDLRTYLTRLTLRAEFIADPEQRTKATRDLAEMSQLLDDTLLFARQEAGRGEVAGPVEVRRELEGLVALRAEMGQAVTLSAGAPVTALVSPVALRRMLDNLVDNALAYGGSVALDAEVADGEARIAVLDRGPGLPDAVLARIAAPFERGEASRNRRTGGAGLGLSIVQALAQAHGGRLVLANREGGGLSATVVLPTAPAGR
ncbi:HAMP domain-containing protein [Caulobacter segnis]|uniref:histidine kinase n=2 Tax=Caulobacter segnis TaxID=88688 RepID=D5VF43_CAUST|nr:ATP-binding protein [Caulobacter segnis]ADG09461.1 integral membrane sensor signal transduction histidine kinase [Caulobacter segnis ATCC 21756]AVQ01255.1 HAMP domain-containing protein [Caulobacter segnis]